MTEPCVAELTTTASTPREELVMSAWAATCRASASSREMDLPDLMIVLSGQRVTFRSEVLYRRMEEPIVDYDFFFFAIRTTDIERCAMYGVKKV